MKSPNVWFFFPTAAGCPTIQFSFDTVYLALSVRSHKLRAQSLRPPHSRCQLQAPCGHLYLWPTGYTLSSHNAFLSFNNLLQQLTELRKTLSLAVSYTIKGMINEQPDEKIHRLSSGFQMQELLLLWNWGAPPSQLMVCSPTQRLPQTGI